MIELMENNPVYAPNEVDLQVATLQARSTTMKNANTGVTNTTVPLSNARISRNNELYGDDAGLVELAGLVKKYVKSLTEPIRRNTAKSAAYNSQGRGNNT